MTQAIYYKEWVKTRRITLILLALSVGLIVYAWLSTGAMFRTSSAVDIWGMAISGRLALLRQITLLLPVVVGVVLGVVQFTAEMVDKRLKLTLHLPVDETRIMWTLYSYGIAVILAISLLYFGVLLGMLRVYFPAEVVMMNFAQIVAHTLCGVGCYLACSYVVVEPVWRRKIGAAAVSIGAVWLFFEGSFSTLGLVSLLVVDAMLLCCAFLSASRFKDGAQQ